MNTRLVTIRSGVDHKNAIRSMQDNALHHPAVPDTGRTHVGVIAETSIATAFGDTSH